MIRVDQGGRRVKVVVKVGWNKCKTKKKTKKVQNIEKRTEKCQKNDMQAMEQGEKMQNSIWW